MADDDTMDGSANTRPSPDALATQHRDVERNSAECLSEDQVVLFLEGLTTSSLRDEIHQHLDACQSCQLLVQSLVGDFRASNPGASPPFRSTTFATGSLIAERYRIERFVGKGGMGEVYLAHDSLMNRNVALKTPLCTSIDDPSALRKFFDEARNVDSITHVNICRIHSLQEHREPGGERPTVPFFTMEFIDGETLGARLRRGALSLAATRSIAGQLLEGLRAAHDKRVLHLDLKSDNVMLRRSSPRLEAVIMDFGLSRQRDAVLRASQYQRAVGTVQYMAFEQLEGRRNLTPAVDVYAFGVVLFEMLTGRLPFSANAMGGMLIKQQRERPPALTSFRPELSPALNTFVQRCLNRSAERRYADARAALAAFEQLPDWTSVNGGPTLLLRWGAASLAFGLAVGPASDALLAPGTHSSTDTAERTMPTVHSVSSSNDGLSQATLALRPGASAQRDEGGAAIGSTSSQGAPTPEPVVRAPSTGASTPSPVPVANESPPRKRQNRLERSTTGVGGRGVQAAPPVPPVPRVLQAVPKAPLPLQVPRPGLNGGRVGEEPLLERAAVSQASAPGRDNHGEGAALRVEDEQRRTSSEQ